MTASELINFAHRAFISCSEDFRYMALLLGSLIYLFCVEKNKFLRYIVCGSFLIMGLFVFPPIVQLGLLFFSEQTYIRILAVIPTGILVAYAVIRNYSGLPDRKQRYIWVCVCVLLLLLSGKYAYTHIYRNGVTENKYYIPDEYVELVSTIPLKKENKVLVCDKEMARAFRKIDGNYELLYGADIDTDEYDDNIEKIYHFLRAEIVPIEDVLSLAKREKVTHIVLYKWTQYETPIGDLLEEGWLSMIGETESYWSFALNKDR